MSRREPERRRRFDGLFASYSSDIVAYCSWRAASASDAQDAVADVFLTAWRRLDQLPEGDVARVWLYATARRVIANQRRSSRRRFALQERVAQETASAPRESSDGEQAVVHEALRLLGPRDREILLLAEWEGPVAGTDRGRDGLSHGDGARTTASGGRRFRAVFEELTAAKPSANQVSQRRIHEHA